MSKINNKIFVFLPIYNEGQSIINLLNNFIKLIKKTRLNIKIIVIDDKSIDHSALLLKKFIKKNNEVNIKIISHKKNKGLCGALKTAFDYIIKQCKINDLIVTMDGDNTHNPEAITKMLEVVKNGADVVICSRFQNGSKVIGVSFFRKFLSFCARINYSFFIRIKNVNDYTCNYRMYRFSIIEKALNHYKNDFITYSNFSCVAEILIKISNFNAKFSEIPMTLNYLEKHSISNMKIIKTIISSLKLTIMNLKK